MARGTQQAEAPALTSIDLFCGAGGLSLGAARAGLDVLAGVEWDQDAIATHAANFPRARHFQSDISRLTGDELLSGVGLVKGQLTALIGGPPCQGFSVIGTRDPTDERNELFGHFMRLVAETEPLFFVAENVPGIAQEKNSAVLKRAMRKIPKFYQVLKPLIVEGHRYGAPTTRKRLFFIGVDTRRLPAPDIATLVPPADAGSVLVGDALRGLPQTVHVPDGVSGEEQWCKVKELPSTAFFNRVKGCIPPGVGNRFAIQRYKTKREVNGHVGVAHSPEVVERYKSLPTGKRDEISRSVKLAIDGHCPTLRAGTGFDKGRFQAVRPIHPIKPRVITPREAARLQGFPDWFLLPPTKWHSFRQIGNSVSPIVAEVVLRLLVQHVLAHQKMEARAAA